MLTHEWRELEVLCERISDLRHRYFAAQRTKNVGLIEGLNLDAAVGRPLPARRRTSQPRMVASGRQ